MDDMDKVQAINDQVDERVVEDHQRSMPRGESYTHCEDCGNAIPEDRRQAMPGCRRCVDCQTDIEITTKHWR